MLISPSRARWTNFRASARCWGFASASRASRNVSGGFGGALSPRPCPGPCIAGSSPLPVGLGTQWRCGFGGFGAFAAWRAAVRAFSAARCCRRKAAKQGMQRASQYLPLG